MKTNLTVVFCLLAFSWCLAPLAAAQTVGKTPVQRTEGNPAFQRVILSKCISCHTRERIDAARKNHRNLGEIERAMEAHGVRLNKHDKEALGAFWGDPLK